MGTICFLYLNNLARDYFISVFLQVEYAWVDNGISQGEAVVTGEWAETKVHAGEQRCCCEVIHPEAREGSAVLVTVVGGQGGHGGPAGGLINVGRAHGADIATAGPQGCGVAHSLLRTQLVPIPLSADALSF